MGCTTKNITLVDQVWLEENKNPDKNLGLYDRLIEKLDTAGGVGCGLSLIQKSARLVNYISQKASPTLKKLDKKLGVATAALGLPAIPDATSSAIKSLSALNETEDGIPFHRKVIKAVKSVAGAISSVGYGWVFIKTNPAVLNVAQTADLTSDAIDLGVSASDYSSAAELEEMAIGEVKEAVRHTKNYNFWRVLKAVTAIAGTVFGAVMAATGITLIPLLAMLILGFSSTLFGLYRDLYKDMGTYKVIEFDREVRLG